ncbi:MAG: hypothetical protein JWR07_4389 [Nevskia sp.]|nr:hypothetical protein [Nevskia sp.]
MDIYPYPPRYETGFLFQHADFLAGQVQFDRTNKIELLEILKQAAAGKIELPDTSLSLHDTGQLGFYSKMLGPDHGFSELHLQINGPQIEQIPLTPIGALDTKLRQSNPPFDGISDLATYLRLPGPTSGQNPMISVHVYPPVSLVRAQLNNERLELDFHAHAYFDIKNMGLAIRPYPNDSVHSRAQIASQVEWGDANNGVREGRVRLDLSEVESVLVMQTIGPATVLRQWISDPKRSHNRRLLAVQHFDQDLKMIEEAVLRTRESAIFENGISALLFLLGFTASVQIEKDAPDLIVTTPRDRLVIIECTTKVADFETKLGKLVDRRGALKKSLQSSGHHNEVAAVLICRQPLDQIVANRDRPAMHKVVLWAQEDLVRLLNDVRFQRDPDDILSNAETFMRGYNDAV